jgi:hypothetical protein
MEDAASGGIHDSRHLAKKLFDARDKRLADAREKETAQG